MPRSCSDSQESRAEVNNQDVTRILAKMMAGCKREMRYSATQHLSWGQTSKMLGCLRGQAGCYILRSKQHPAFSPMREQIKHFFCNHKGSDSQILVKEEEDKKRLSRWGNRPRVTGHAYWVRLRLNIMVLHSASMQHRRVNAQGSKINKRCLLLLSHISTYGNAIQWPLFFKS